MSSSPNPSNDTPQAILKTDEPYWDDDKMGPIPPGMNVAEAFAPGGKLADLRDNLLSAEKKLDNAKEALETARREYNKALDKTMKAEDAFEKMHGKKRAAEKAFYDEVELHKTRHLARRPGHDGESL